MASAEMWGKSSRLLLGVVLRSHLVFEIPEAVLSPLKGHLEKPHFSPLHFMWQGTFFVG